MIYYTYKVVCTYGNWNGIYYYGKHQTNDLNDGYICSSKKLRNYLKKHPNEYTRQIIGFYDSLKDVNEAEKQLIASCIDDPKCANIAKGGDGGDVGYWRNPEYRKTDAYKERCRKISIAAKHRWDSYSEEERAQISKNMSANYTPHNVSHPGWTHTEEWKRKQSERMKNHIVSEETCKKLRESWTKMDPIKRKERNEKIRQNNIGRKASEETKQKLRKKQLGVPSPHKGKIGISKGNIKTYIFEDQLDDYIKMGFKKGFK